VCTQSPSVPADDPNDCPYPTSGRYFIFEGEDGDPENLADQIVYKYDSVAGTVSKSTTGLTGTYVDLNPSTVFISSFRVHVTGSNSPVENDLFQPQVTIAMKGRMEDAKGQIVESFYQSSVVSRRIDWESLED
jgi:hypothetical protein